MEALNTRETEILNYIIDGKSLQQIAFDSGIPLDTVKRICQSIFRKLTDNKASVVPEPVQKHIVDEIYLTSPVFIRNRKN